MSFAIPVDAVTDDLMKRRKRLARIVAFYSKIGLKIFNVKLTVNGKVPRGPFLIVANHMSYIDIICISSVMRANFVTSVEIKETAGLGYLTRLGGSLYVERRNKANIRNEIQDVTNALKAGINVGIFPEATSTNGDEVIRFRRPLFAAAYDANVPVLPMTINYRSIDDTLVTAKNRDYLAWYGDMDFMPHLLKLMSLRKIEISIDIHEPFMITSEEEIGEAADRAHDTVASKFRPLGETQTQLNLTVQ